MATRSPTPGHPPLSLLRALLRPVVRFCLRRSLHIQDVVDAAKEIFVEEAARSLDEAGERINISRLSVLTGLQRRDCLRLINAPADDAVAPQGLVQRILGQWQSDRRFSTGTKARTLSCEGEESEFHALCTSVSHDLNPGTVLFELERVGSVERVGKKLKLRRAVFVPRKRDLAANLTLLTNDVDDLIRAVEGNLLAPGGPHHLHAKTEYDNIDPAALPAIREWFFVEGEKFHARAREHLARYDRDINPRAGGRKQGGRVAIGTFSLIS